MIERWKSIPGHNGYMASNYGRIKSLPSKVNNNGGMRHIPERILSQWKAKNTGYLQADIGGSRVSVHRVIASTWCPCFFDGAHVDHINAQRDDNRSDNLEWVSVSENVKRSFRNGRENPYKGIKSAAHPTSKAVLAQCIETGEINFWPSAMDAVRAGFDSSCISRCCNGKSRSHKGCEWKFAEYGARHGVEWRETNRAGFGDAE